MESIVKNISETKHDGVCIETQHGNLRVNHSLRETKHLFDILSSLNKERGVGLELISISDTNVSKKIRDTCIEAAIKISKDYGYDTSWIPESMKHLTSMPLNILSSSVEHNCFQLASPIQVSVVKSDHILDNYTFDRELRLIVFDCIERIEIAIRTQIIHVLSSKYNSSHWQDDKSLFKAPYRNYRGDIIDSFGEAQKIITTARLAKNPEVFIKHYSDNYDYPINPPSWMCLELFTIGEMSRLYNGLELNQDKQLIADFFGLHHTVFSSWLHSLTYVRNICAHHSRLWNRALAIKPDIILKPKRPWLSKPFENNQRTFYFLCTLKYWLNSANPSNHLKEKLVDLFNRYPTVPIQFLGIPSDGHGNMLDWQKEPVWS